MKSSTYLITGGAGFIGSNLADVLLAEGHSVLALDNLSTGCLENLAHVQDHPEFRFVRASIFDETVMDNLASRADVIVHLAAAVGVQLVVRKPVHTIRTNIMGTEAVLRAARRYGRKVLLASTSEVYGKNESMPLGEDDNLLLGSTSKNRWSYAASKIVDELLGLAYHREYDIDVVVARLFNIVGPRQTGRYGMVIPRFVRQALKGDPITVYGDGSQSRCFCHVRDAVAALLGLCRHEDAPGDVYNIGGTDEVRIGELAERVKALARSDSPIVQVPYGEAYPGGFEDIARRVPDIRRVGALLGWQPSASLEDVLLAVIDDERTGRRNGTSTEEPFLGAGDEHEAS